MELRIVNYLQIIHRTYYPFFSNLLRLLKPTLSITGVNVIDNMLKKMVKYTIKKQ